MHIGGDAHNGEKCAVAPLKALADRILTGEILLRQGLTDDGHVQCVRTVLLGEISALKQWNSHSSEVAGTDQRILREVIIVGGGVLQAEPDLPRVAQWKMTRRSQCADAGQMRKPIQQLLLHSLAFRRIRITVTVEKSSDHELAVRIKAE